MVHALATQSYTPFKWSRRHEEAAVLVADDRLTDEQIANQVGITRKQLWTWRQHPEFAAKVAEHVEQFAEVTLKRGIAQRARRVAALDDRWQRMQQVIEARANDPGHALMPGGETGLIVRTERHIGPVTTVEYAVDTGLLKELREHEKQAAQEIGQWTEKREVTGKDGAPLVFTIVIDRRDDDDSNGI